MVLLTNYVKLTQVFDDLKVCSVENGGKLRFLCLLGPGTLLRSCSSGRDRLSNVAPNSGSQPWDFCGLYLWLWWPRWWFSRLQRWHHLLSSSKPFPSTAHYDTRDLLDLLVLIFRPIRDNASMFTCWVLCFLWVNRLSWLFTCRGS
jgi:hypothetical protein